MSPMRNLTLPLVLFCCAVLGPLRAQDLEPAPSIKPPPRPVDPSLREVDDVAGLPRVLLIGDSISMGYTLGVRQLLAGKANVHHPSENCGPTERGLARLDLWLGKGHWDVIHFNFGLHDLKYLDAHGAYVSPEKGKQVAPVPVYVEHLRTLVTRLKATGARLVFATTTPVPPATLGRVAGDERAYNAAALGVMRSMGVDVDDLGGYVEERQVQLPPRPESQVPPPHHRVEPRPGEIQLPFNVHFTPEGYQQLSALVAASILRELEQARGASDPVPAP